MNKEGGKIMGALFNVFFNDYNGSEDNFLIDGKLVQGKFFFVFFVPFYHSKIHPVTNYNAIKNKINKTR